MIDLHSIQQSILRHPIYRAEVPYTLQLGLPRLSVDCGNLYLQYCPHRMVKRDRCLELYPPEFSFTFLYPFQKLVSFSNLRLARGMERTAWDTPICAIEDAWNAELLDKLNGLWKDCENTLDKWVKSGRAGLITDYHNTFERVTGELGIAMLYR